MMTENEISICGAIAARYPRPGMTGGLDLQSGCSVASAAWRMLCRSTALLLRGVMMMAGAGNAHEAPRVEAEREFVSLIGDHRDVIDRICWSFANSRADYDDMFQDVLINLWRGMGGWRAESSLNTWVYRIALNTCVSTWRRRSRRPDMSGLEGVERLGSDNGNRYEEIQWLHTLLGSLGSVDRSIIIMWLDSRTYEEIAEVMGMNRNTVATRVSRARERMRRMAADRRV